MPPRLNLTPEQFEQRVREQANARQRRRRERLKEAGSVTVVASRDGHVTADGFSAYTNGHAHAGTDAHGSFPLVTSSPTEKRDTETTSDLERVRCVLEPLPGYVHDEELLRRLAENCPAVDLVLEAIGMADWLNRLPNRKRVCSKAFIRNWVRRVHLREVEETNRPQPITQRASPRSALGRVLEQIATDPVEGPSTWR